MQTDYPPLVIDAAENEFAFVNGMPRRQKARWQKLHDAIDELRAVAATDGIPLPPLAAAEFLGVHRSRVYQFIEEGRLRSVTIAGHVYVTEKSLKEFAATPRPTGRPFKAGNGPVLAACSALSGAGLLPPKK